MVYVESVWARVEYLGVSGELGGGWCGGWSNLSERAYQTIFLLIGAAAGLQLVLPHLAVGHGGRGSGL